jgi:prepilin-type N-terminal cleavage/methylation domain-containing protein
MTSAVKTNHGPPARRSGFTLIELLVVIAIIAILAAILFPVFAKARERAKLSACISNQKQLALAVMTYADDYDQKMPFGISFTDGELVNGKPIPGGKTYSDGYRSARSSWFYHLIEPYTKSKEIFQCPSVDAGNQKLNSSANANGRKDDVTYRFNPYASGQWAQDGTQLFGTAAAYRPMSLSQCARPSEFALLRERVTQYHWPRSAGALDYDKVRSPLAMADGSVKMRGGKETIPANDPAPWQYMNTSFWWTGREPRTGPH